MRAFAFLPFLSLLASSSLASPQAWLQIKPSSSPEDGAIRLKVLSSDRSGTLLDLEILGIFKGQVELEEGLFDTLSLEEGVVTQPGKPATPFVSRFIAIPFDAFPSVEILADEVTIVENIRVAPAQIRPKRCGPSTPPRFVCDRTIYNGRSLYPSEVVTLEETGVMRDLRFVRIRINPLQFDPPNNRLIVHHHLRLLVRHHGSTFLRTPYVSETFERSYARTFINYGAVRMREAPLPAVEKVLIVTPGKFAGGVEPYAQWKRTMGFRVQVVPLEQIGKTSTDLKKYLQSLYQDPFERPTYVVLVGDVADMPTNHGTGGCASDFIYSLLEGNDLVSDVLVSRFSVKDSADLAVQVSKVVFYESEVLASPSSKWLEGAVCISSSEGEGTSNDDYRSNIICGLFTNYGYNPVNKLYESNGGNTVSKISGAINEGRGIVSYLGHGSGTSWASTNPEFSTEDVEALTNYNKLVTVFDVSCDNGAFDQYPTCFAESWMRATKPEGPTGAVAIYSASTPAYWDEPGEMAIGMAKALTEKGIRRWGEIALAGRIYLQQVFGTTPEVQETFEQYILFGDASLMIRTKTPEALQVEGPTVLPVADVEETFVITKSNGSSAPSALLHVFGENVDVAGYADAQGRVTLEIAPDGPGQLNVVATAPDAQPWYGTIDVVVTGCGIVKVKPSVASCTDTITVSLWDQDLNKNPNQSEKASVEVVGNTTVLLTLNENGIDSSQFTGSFLPKALGLNPYHGMTLTVRYKDQDCNGAPAEATSEVTFDCKAPTISKVQIVEVTATTAKVSWRTDENAFSALILEGGEGQGSYPSGLFGTQHLVVLQGLAPSTHYTFKIEAKDAVGNYTVTDPSWTFDTPACTPNCEGKVCGPDGCGGVCGHCQQGQECNEKGQCFGGPGCEESWTPGCGGCKCEACVCAMDFYCCWSAWDHICVEECMNDCGGCGAATCIPNCAGKECGSDGCGGSCGSCQEGFACVGGLCQCIPKCQGKECGPDGCGGLCGACPQGYTCDDKGKCVPTCTPNCDQKECGDDGCGGECGTCGPGTMCVLGHCECAPNCADRQCGDDGCGGSCGECGPGLQCVEGRCVCKPVCEGKECGPDGCGGSCGDCKPGEICTLEGRCAQRPSVSDLGPDAHWQDAPEVSEEAERAGGSSGCASARKPGSFWAPGFLLMLVLVRVFLHFRKKEAV